MSSLSQRLRSMRRQRSLQKGIVRLDSISNCLWQVGQRTVAMAILWVIPPINSAESHRYYSDDFGFLLLSPPESLLDDLDSPEDLDSLDEESALAAFL